MNVISTSGSTQAKHAEAEPLHDTPKQITIITRIPVISITYIHFKSYMMYVYIYIYIYIYTHTYIHYMVYSTNHDLLLVFQLFLFHILLLLLLLISLLLLLYYGISVITILLLILLYFLIIIMVYNLLLLLLLHIFILIW